MKKRNYALHCVDEEIAAREHGYRNFISFAAVNYYVSKHSLIDCGRMIGVSATKMKTALLKRGFRLRRRGRLPGKAPIKKREVDIWLLVRRHTAFHYPWCALYTLYIKYELTSYEISAVLHISQPVILKLLHEYGIPVRHSGKFSRKQLGRKYALSRVLK